MFRNLKQRETPVDLELQKAFSKLIGPGMYFLEKPDRSMAPAIPKNAILVLEEDQAITQIVHLEYRGKHPQWEKQRFIRKCVRSDRPNHWMFTPINLHRNYPTFTSTPFNITDTVILGSRKFVLYFGSRRSTSKIIDELLEIGSFENLLKRSESNKEPEFKRFDRQKRDIGLTHQMRESLRDGLAYCSENIEKFSFVVLQFENSDLD